MEEKELKISGSGRIKYTSWIQFLLVTVIVIILSILCTFINIRLDLTEDHRYTLSAPTHEILSKLKNDVYIQVYLDGEMDIAFRRLRRSLKEMLDEFHVASGKKLEYEFINPSAGKDDIARNKQYDALNKKGLIPVDIRAMDEEGGTSRKRIYPGMIVNYNGVEVPVNFLSNNTSLSPEQNLLHSVEGLEYQMIQTISTLCSDTVYKVAFLEGHNELPESEVSDVTLSLAKFFTIDRGAVRGRQDLLNRYSALVIAGPEKSFDEKDKLAIDQYIMNGGKVLWLFEEVKVNEDSLISGETIALYWPLNIEDQLFKYGVRVNPAIIQDVDCIRLPIKVETGASRQQIVPFPWIYYPLLIPSSVNPVTRNLNKIQGRFVNYIDTVGENRDVNKTILLTSSKLSRIVRPPLMISLKEIDSPPEIGQFNKSYLPVAVLLEGKFQSAFRNRMINDLVEDKSFRMREESKPTKMIIAADADIIRNGTSQDRLTLGTFGNKDFIVNCLNYLVDNIGIMELRSRELKLRLLDKTLIRQKRLMIQIVNTTLPVILVIIAGIIYNFLRRNKYAKY
jgi:gliding-associated putative ABC transporter substrate-binding component GldG